jgi:hypothetical protein
MSAMRSVLRSAAWSRALPIGMAACATLFAGCKSKQEQPAGAPVAGAAAPGEPAAAVPAGGRDPAASHRRQRVAHHRRDAGVRRGSEGVRRGGARWKPARYLREADPEHAQKARRALLGDRGGSAAKPGRPPPGRCSGGWLCKEARSDRTLALSRLLLPDPGFAGTRCDWWRA